MAKTLLRRPVGGTVTAQNTLAVKLSPTGKFLWTSAVDGSNRQRRMWNGSEYVTTPAMSLEIAEFAVAWTEDESLQVLVGRQTGVSLRLYLRSVDPSTGAMVQLFRTGLVLNDTTPVRGIERISGDTFIAYGASRTCVFRIDRTTDEIVVIDAGNTVFSGNPIRGIAATGNSNIIVIHYGPVNASNGFQSFSVNLTTGALTAIGSKIIQGEGQISGFDLREGKLITHSRYTLDDVMHLELNASNGLVAVPGFNATTFQNNMVGEGSPNSAGFIRLGFGNTEINYLPMTEPAVFWSASRDDYDISDDFDPPPSIPTGVTNAVTTVSGETASRSYVSYSEDGKVFAFTFPTSSPAGFGVFVYSEYEDQQGVLIAVAPMADTVIVAETNDSAELVAVAPMAYAVIVANKQSSGELVNVAPMAYAVIVADNTIPGELVPVAPMAYSVMRASETTRRGQMVVQKL